MSPFIVSIFLSLRRTFCCKVFIFLLRSAFDGERVRFAGIFGASSNFGFFRGVECRGVGAFLLFAVDEEDGCAGKANSDGTAPFFGVFDVVKSKSSGLK